MTDRWNIPSAIIDNNYQSQKMNKCAVNKRFDIILSTTTIGSECFIFQILDIYLNMKTRLYIKHNFFMLLLSSPCECNNIIKKLCLTDI